MFDRSKGFAPDRNISELEGAPPCTPAAVTSLHSISRKNCLYLKYLKRRQFWAHFRLAKTKTMDAMGCRMSGLTLKPKPPEYLALRSFEVTARPKVRARLGCRWCYVPCLSFPTVCILKSLLRVRRYRQTWTWTPHHRHRTYRPGHTANRQTHLRPNERRGSTHPMPTRLAKASPLPETAPLESAGVVLGNRRAMPWMPSHHASFFFPGAALCLTNPSLSACYVPTVPPPFILFPLCSPTNVCLIHALV